MKNFILMLFVLANSQLINTANAGTELNDAFKLYAGPEKLTFSAEKGKQFWLKDGITKEGKLRNCSTCHGDDLTKMGRHAKSGKDIDPMAPSINHERFVKLKKIKKWFKRNCKWTIGRECTNQEKGDILTYLSNL